jgi:hypothetical protein
MALKKKRKNKNKSVSSRAKVSPQIKKLAAKIVDMRKKDLEELAKY